MPDVPAARSLAELTARYMPAPTEDCPVFLEDSSVKPVVDGITYFRELDRLMAELRPGDAVYIAGYQAEPHLDLSGRTRDDPGYRAFTDVLAEKAADSVDVRVVLSAAEFSGGIPWLPVGPFRANVIAARVMRAWVPSTGGAVAPLRDRVLLDWSGPPLGSNHQKVVVFSIAGRLTAFVGGLDLSPTRYDEIPHDRLKLGTYRWGWHDAAARLHGAAALRVWNVFLARWETTASLPTRRIAKHLPERYFRIPRGGFTELNPPGMPRGLPPVPPDQHRPEPGTAVQVARSYSPWSVSRHRGLRRVQPATVTRMGVHEVYRALTTAINAAERYIYLEDQYFHEAPGGSHKYELYDQLRAAAHRGVKLILVGSGRKDPADGGDSLVKPVITRDLRRRIIDRLPLGTRRNVIMYRVRDLTVHTKLMLIDDVFASIGSANFFSRSMVGTDSELTCTMVTTETLVRDLRVRLWAEHLRAPLNEPTTAQLRDLDVALGIWRAEWLPPDAPADTWRRPGCPAGFEPAERVLIPVRYSRRHGRLLPRPRPMAERLSQKRDG